LLLPERECEEFCQGGRRPSGLRSTPTANFPEGAAALVSTRSPGVCGDRQTTRLSGYLGQRPPDLSPPVARWTDGTGQCGTDGSSGHGGAPDRRGPVALAKSLAAIDLLSGGRLVVGMGPGSSARDYAAVGISFEERWKRLEEAVLAMRALWLREGSPFKGEFYSTEGVVPEPYPTQQPGPPIWIGSWGSEAGLGPPGRRLASAYNTTPEAFTNAWGRLTEHLHAAGKDPNRFPNAIATMFFFVTEERAAAGGRIVREVLNPTLNRPEEELSQRLLVGPAGECAEKLVAYQAAGAQRIFLWPVENELRQLALFRERVAAAAT